MLISDLLHPDSVLVPLRAGNREAVTALLVDVRRFEKRNQ